MVVNDISPVADRSLLGTFHKYLRTVHCHADGIEANHLSDGIGNGLMVNGSGDTKILQLVVEKVDFKTGLFRIQLAQGFADGHVVILAGYALLR